MELHAAINELRPEFPQRDSIRQALQNCCRANNHTYFQTIPYDIVGIIHKFIPDLRRKYTSADIEQMHNDAVVQYHQFMARYLHHRANNVNYLSISQITQDFPELVPIQRYQTLYIKIVSGQLLVYLYNSVDPIYLGNNKFLLREFDGAHRITSNEVPQNARMVAHHGPSIPCFDMECTKLLPCGLVLSYRSGGDKTMRSRIYSIMDPDNGNNKEIWDVDYACDNMGPLPIDDYGKRPGNNINGYHLEPLMLCDKTSAFLKMYGF